MKWFNAWIMKQKPENPPKFKSFWEWKVYWTIWQISFKTCEDENCLKCIVGFICFSGGKNRRMMEKSHNFLIKNGMIHWALQTKGLSKISKLLANTRKLGFKGVRHRCRYLLNSPKWVQTSYVWNKSKQKMLQKVAKLQTQRRGQWSHWTQSGTTLTLSCNRN